MMTEVEYAMLIALLIYILWNEFDKSRIIREMRKRYKGLACGRRKRNGRKSIDNQPGMSELS